MEDREFPATYCIPYVEYVTSSSSVGVYHVTPIDRKSTT